MRLRAHPSHPIRPAAGALLLGLLLLFPPVAAREREEEPERRPSPAESVAGRWRISLEGLAEEHEPLLASLAVEGEILFGSLTAGRKTVPIHSGRIVGSQFRFSFRHVGGDVFTIKGSPGPRGLEGTWQGGGQQGRWRAQPLKR